jgi:hypothetical protein
MTRPKRQSARLSSFMTDTCVIDHTVWLWLRSRELPDYALVYAYAGPGLPTMGICQLGDRPLLISDV